MPIPTKEGTRQAYVDIDLHSAECPKSILLRDTDAPELVQISNQAVASGFDSLGPASEWPGAFYDVQTILAQRRMIDENAQRAAIQKL